MRVGFIGPGQIGRGMAHGLLASGFPTTVYDLISEGRAELSAAGADPAGSPTEVVAASGAVGVCVRTDDEALDAIAVEKGLLSGASPGLPVAVHSTVLPSAVQEAARFVDAGADRRSPGSRSPLPPEMMKAFEAVTAVAEKALDDALEVGRDLGVDLPGAAGHPSSLSQRLSKLDPHHERMT